MAAMNPRDKLKALEAKRAGLEKEIKDLLQEIPKEFRDVECESMFSIDPFLFPDDPLFRRRKGRVTWTLRDFPGRTLIFGASQRSERKW